MVNTPQFTNWAPMHNNMGMIYSYTALLMSSVQHNNDWFTSAVCTNGAYVSITLDYFKF